MRILYIGGTGEISLSCVQESVAAGHDVSVFNRGVRNVGLPDGVTILNWNRTSTRPRSIEFFARNASPQVITGYYDGRPPLILQQLTAGPGRESIVGAMYATVARDFSQIAQFARDAWGGGSAR